MPTKLRRIAVTEDSELASALRSASDALPGLSDAALVKQLAIIGARTVSERPPNEHLEQILKIPGARLPSRPLGPLLDEIASLPKVSSAEVDRILEEERTERF
jgi:hypothetical protein